MSSVVFFTTYFKGTGAVGVKHPPFEEIERMLREIDSGRVLALKLFKCYEWEGSGEQHLAIFGKQSLYHVSEWILGEETHTFCNEEVDPVDSVEIDGYPYQLKQFCTDLDVVIAIASEYFDHGKLSDKVKWW